jgi:RNA polymerase sigma-70 factor (ECF subfamily)
MDAPTQDGGGGGGTPPFDEILGKAIGKRDFREAVQLLMDRHGQQVFRYCVRLVRDRALASDLLQQVFVQAYRDLGSLEACGRADAWLMKIALHRCLDAIKARRRFEKRFVNGDGVELEDRIAVDTPARDPVEMREQNRALEECLGGLKEEDRAAVLLRFKEEMTYEMMAEALGANLRTLQRRVARALPRLRRCLEEKGIVS